MCRSGLNNVHKRKHQKTRRNDMKKIGFWVLLVSIGLVGCSNKQQEAYESAMATGVSEAKKDNYAKAEAYFE